MKKFKNLMEFLGNALSSFALSVGTLSANSTCVLYFHQPKAPAKLNELKK